MHAAIRPRYGAGPGTALRAGVAAWVFVHLLAGIANANLGLLPRRMIAISTAWAFGELVVAALVGAWVYREPGEVTIVSLFGQTLGHSISNRLSTRNGERAWPEGSRISD